MPAYTEYGEIDYTIVNIDAPKREFSYSAEQLQLVLERACSGQKLNGIYVNLDGYLEAIDNSENMIDLTYMGGPTLLVFDSVVMEIEILGEGLTDYRVFPVFDMRSRSVHGYPPDDMVMCERYYYNAHDYFYLKYAGHRVTSIAVEGVNSWSFSVKGFDDEAGEKAAENGQLPNSVNFRLDNGVTVSLKSDCLEYYRLFLKEYS